MITRPQRPANRSHVMIAGASVRAAIQSVVRSGETKAIAADLFQDRDLAGAIRCRLVAGYADLPRVAAERDIECWMYTGALENYPQIVDSIQVPLLGNGGDVLKHVRDPWRVRDVLAQAGIRAPRLARHPSEIPAAEAWLRKPFASAGGTRIKRVTADVAIPHDSSVYYQQFVNGQACSAVFVAANGESRWLGTTRQFLAATEQTENRFLYRGSIGPIINAPPHCQQWTSIGRALAAAFKLTGLFGVDAIATQASIQPVEVNPRFTASIEVLERTLGWNAWQLQVLACQQGQLPSPAELVAHDWAAKRIVFAQQACSIDANFLAWLNQQNSHESWPRFADLPAKPCLIRPGAPVLTVLSGPLPSERQTLEQLDERIATLQTMLPVA